MLGRAVLGSAVSIAAGRQVPFSTRKTAPTSSPTSRTTARAAFWKKSSELEALWSTAITFRHHDTRESIASGGIEARKEAQARFWNIEPPSAFSAGVSRYRNASVEDRGSSPRSTSTATVTVAIRRVTGSGSSTVSPGGMPGLPSQATATEPLRLAIRTVSLASSSTRTCRRDTPASPTAAIGTRIPPSLVRGTNGVSGSCAAGSTRPNSTARPTVNGSVVPSAGRPPAARTVSVHCGFNRRPPCG